MQSARCELRWRVASEGRGQVMTSPLAQPHRQRLRARATVSHTVQMAQADALFTLRDGRSPLERASEADRARLRPDDDVMQERD